MGVVNVAWRKAMAEAGQSFTPDEKNSGWSETFIHFQLAALQYPHRDATTKRLARTRAADFLNACLTGALRNSATTVVVTPTAQPSQRPNTVASDEWLMRDEFGSTVPSRRTRAPYEVTFYAVKALAFSTWLAAQGEAPSQHIAAWFKSARSVGGELVLEALKHAPNECDTSAGIAKNGRWMFSVDEAIQEVKRDLGHAFTDSEFLDFAAHNSVTLFAVVPSNATVSIRDIGPGRSYEELGTHGPGRFDLGLVSPPLLKELLIRGGTICKLPVGYRELADRLFIFHTPFTVSRADLRVGPNSLRAFISAVRRVHDRYPDLQYRLPDRMQKDGTRGNAADAAQLRVVQYETSELTNWSQLVAFRKVNVGAEWKPNQKNIAATEANRRKESPGATGVAKAMAEELSITVSRFNDLVRSANSEGKRAAARSNAA